LGKVSELNLVLFSALRKASKPFSRAGVGKIPGVRRAYHFLNELVWLWHKSIIEVQGSKMYVNVRDKDPSMRNTFRTYALNRVHEASTTILFKEVVKEGATVVDLGANIGYFTLLAAKLVGKRGTVYSFEPEPRNYNYLLRNLELNGYGNVIANNKAASDKNGKIKLYICPYDSGHHTIKQDEGIKSYNPDFTIDDAGFIEVEMVALDDYFKETKRPIDVIKMDVEGAEMLALSGMDRLIKESGNLTMFVEFFPLLLRKMGSSPEEFIRRLLEDYNFSIFVIGRDYSMHDYAPNEGYLKINSVDELMKLCQGKMNHVNLLLKKGDQ